MQLNLNLKNTLNLIYSTVKYKIAEVSSAIKIDKHSQAKHEHHGHLVHDLPSFVFIIICTMRPV